MHHPAHFARELLTEFQACAKKDGVDLASIELHHAEFLVLPAVKQAMSSASLVYINNNTGFLYKNIEFCLTTIH